jgi:hypothetical protein
MMQVYIVIHRPIEGLGSIAQAVVFRLKLILCGQLVTFKMTLMSFHLAIYLQDLIPILLTIMNRAKAQLTYMLLASSSDLTTD